MNIFNFFVFFLSKIDVLYSESFNDEGKIMLDKIQTKIDALQQGKKLILGSGIQSDEMQKIIALCESLQSSGQIKIVKFNKDETKPNALARSIIIERQ